MKFRLEIGHVSPPRDDSKVIGVIEAKSAKEANTLGQEYVRERASSDEPLWGTLQVHEAPANTTVGIAA